MKRKLMSVLTAALLVFAFGAQVHASTFVAGDLIRVAYDTGTSLEEGTDLGSLSTILGTSGSQTLGSGASAVQLSDLGATSWSQVNVAYFAVAIATSNQVQNPASFAVVSSTAGSVNNSQNGWNAFSTNAHDILNYYLGGATPANLSQAIVPTGSSTATDSYYQQMDGGGSIPITVATFTGWITTQTGEVNAGNGTSQNMNLFQWVGSTISFSNGRNTYYGLNVSQPGTLIAGLQTVEGTSGLYTTLTSDAAPVPVPPSVLLLAPGLLGLVGLRKKFRT